MIDINKTDLSAINHYALTNLLTLNDMPPATMSQITNYKPIRTQLLKLNVPSETTPKLLDQLLLLPNLIMLGTNNMPKTLLDHPIFDHIKLLVINDTR